MSRMPRPRADSPARATATSAHRPAPGVAATRPGSLDLRLLGPALCAWVAVALLLGRPAGESLGVASAAVVVASAVALGAARHGRRRAVPQRTPAAALALGCVLAALALVASAGHHAAREAGPLAELAAGRAVATLEGVVVGDPRRRPGGGDDAAERAAVVVRVETVTARGLTSRVRSPVLVFGDDAWLGLHWGERVRTTGRLRPATPGDDVVALLAPRRPPQVSRGSGWLLTQAERLRDGLRRATSGLPRDAAGLVPGLVVGDRSGLPPDLADDMRASGMTHLTAVSGTNTTLVCVAAVGLCGVLGVPRRARPPVGLLVLAAFVVVARPDPSVLRAAVMGAVGLLGLSRSRRSAGAPALGAAILVLLALDPHLSRSYGFALSVLATLGLLVLAGPWSRRWAAHLPRRYAPLATAVAVPLAAQVACAPVIVLLQGSVTFVGVAANVAAAPLVAPATLGGVVITLVAPIAPGLAAALAWVPGAPALGIAVVARTAAGVPFGTLPWPDGAGGAWLLTGAVLAVLLAGAVLVRFARRWAPWLAAVLVLLVAALAPLPSRSWPGPEPLLVACDVGQGDALVLPTAPGRAVLVDAGPEPVAVDRCLRRLHVGALDALVLTHYDADHVFGLPGAIRGREVAAVLVSPSPQRPAATARVQGWLAAAGLRPRAVAAGDVLTWGPVTAIVRGPVAAARDSPNNGSLVLDVRTRGLRALLLGDAEREEGADVRRALARSGAAPRVDVVKAAHHGSADFDPGLYALTRPCAVLVSVGADNTYGHPAPSALAAARRVGAVVARTDRGGDLAVGREGGRLVVRAARPAWDPP